MCEALGARLFHVCLPVAYSARLFHVCLPVAHNARLFHNYLLEVLVTCSLHAFSLFIPPLLACLPHVC